MSSVLVKGMKMPDSCYHCKIAESCGHYITNYTNRRHPDCPLIALPDKHGRLGDLDALLDEIAVMPIDIGFGDVERIENIIREIPTIVEAEEANDRPD